MAFSGGLYYAVSQDLRPSSKQDLQANLQAHESQPGKMAGENNENLRNHRITMKGDPSAPGAGRPDPNEEKGPKAMGPGAASPDIADPVRTRRNLPPAIRLLSSTTVRSSWKAQEFQLHVRKARGSIQR
jgi:hypothetical protein